MHSGKNAQVKDTKEIKSKQYRGKNSLSLKVSIVNIFLWFLPGKNIPIYFLNRACILLFEWNKNLSLWKKERETQNLKFWSKLPSNAAGSFSVVKKVFPGSPLTMEFTWFGGWRMRRRRLLNKTFMQKINCPRNGVPLGNSCTTVFHLRSVW